MNEFSGSGEQDVPNLRIGSPLPTRQIVPGETTLFLFSAATWNAHRIHYDRQYAELEGHDDLLVQGSLQGNWLVQIVTNWLIQHEPRIERVRYRNVAPAYVNEVFTVGGAVSAVESERDGTRIHCEVWVEGPRGLTTRGEVLALVGDVGRRPTSPTNHDRQRSTMTDEED